jgi:hypothetical protein
MALRHRQQASLHITTATTARAAAFPLLALLLFLAAGCGGGSGGSGGGTGATDSTVAAATTDTTNQPGGPPQTPLTGPLQTTPTTRANDPYLPVGVVDQVFPPGTKAFELLAAGNCGPLLRQVEQAEAPTTATWKEGGVPDQLTLLYTAAAHACLAHWSIAQTDFQQVKLPIDCGFRVTSDGLTIPNWSSSFTKVADCHTARTLVYNWTKGLLAAHRADPKFVPNFPTPPKP